MDVRKNQTDMLKRKNYLEELLSETENAMESYMQYRTFESIDKYFHYEALLEETAQKLRFKPSVVAVQQKEYIIKQLSINYFNLSGNAIAARGVCQYRRGRNRSDND